jgi:hypothetical protein
MRHSGGAEHYRAAPRIITRPAGISGGPTIDVHLGAGRRRELLAEDQHTNGRPRIDSQPCIPVRKEAFGVEKSSTQGLVGAIPFGVVVHHGQ